MKLKHLIMALAVIGIAAPGMALATTGYFSHGFGIKSIGMGGVGIALPQDSLAAATNPAGMVMVGNRADFGLNWFRPTREAEVTGSPVPGFNGTYDGNETKNFFIPEFGYNRMLSPTMSVGVSVFGNGGMNTDYGRNPFAALGATGNAGVDLSQLFVSPTFAIKVTPDHALGISLNFAYQRFKAYGIQPFAGFSSDGTSGFNNPGYDDATGWGARIGWTGNITPTITLGATYQTKTRMSKFDKYKGLFAEQGDFDIPENYGIGIAVKATPALTIAADVQQINYSKIGAVGNQVDCLFTGACPLGSGNGAGFGWRDVTVFKIGANYAVNPNLTLRVGFATLRQPIPASQTLLNILAPGVVENHLTLGATWALSPTTELSVAYMHAFEKTVNGSGSIPAVPLGGGEANLRMYQNSLGVAFGWKM